MKLVKNGSLLDFFMKYTVQTNNNEFKVRAKKYLKIYKCVDLILFIM
jgi:hypothetical protein